jgi:hypothetical protein
MSETVTILEIMKKKHVSHYDGRYHQWSSQSFNLDKTEIQNMHWLLSEQCKQWSDRIDVPADTSLHKSHV